MKLPTKLGYIVISVFLLTMIGNNELYSSNLIEYLTDTSSCRVQIVKVVSKNEAYLVYAIVEKDSCQIVMVSLKSRNKQGETIKVGNSYQIKLIPYYQEDIFPDHMIIFDVVISGKKIMVPSAGWASNVYTSPNLSGLKITPN